MKDIFPLFVNINNLSSEMQFLTFFSKCAFYNTCLLSSVQEYPIFVNQIIIIYLLMCKIVYDLKGACNFKTHLREIVREVT